MSSPLFDFSRSSNNGTIVKSFSSGLVNNNGSGSVGGGGTNLWIFEPLDFTTIKPNLPAFNVHILGDLTVDGAFINPSDLKLKENISEIDIGAIDEKLMTLVPKQYNMKKDIVDGDGEKKIHYGFIAQELETLFPELVIDNHATNTKSVNYIELIPMLLLKIQHLQQQITELSIVTKK
jgi:hypothetical protein